jgi:hypothetical protein
VDHVCDAGYGAHTGLAFESTAQRPVPRKVCHFSSARPRGVDDVR